MITESGAGLGLICVIILIQSCLADPDLPKARELQSVLDAGVDDPTWEMVMEAAHEMFSENNPKYRDRRDSDEKTLLRDAVIYPFVQHGPRIRMGELGSFLRHLTLTYRLFWPTYVARKPLPGGSIETPACRWFLGAVEGEQMGEKMKTGHFFAAVGEIQGIVRDITGIIQAGDLPYKYNEAIEIYNTLIDNQIILDTEERLSSTVGRRQKIPIDYIINIYKDLVEREERRKAGEDEEWKALVNSRLAVSLGAATMLHEMAGKNKRGQGRNDGAGSSGS